MAKKVSFFLIPHRAFSSSTPEKIPTLYSFLQPSVFALTKNQPQPISEPSQKVPPCLSPEQLSTLESTLHKSLISSNTDEAWRSFKALTSHQAFPPKPLTNSLLTHLSSLGDTLNLKRAFASLLFLMEKNPLLLHHHTLNHIMHSMRSANTAAPAFALVRSMFRNRLFVPFHVWGPVLVQISRSNGSLAAFLRVFEENCRLALEEGVEFMKPDVGACNAALEGCCCELESVSDAERVVGIMAKLGVRPDESSFGFLGYLYALKGLQEKIQGSSIVVDKSIGYGIVNACVSLGVSDKAHSILDEMNALGASVGLGVYVPILKAYCKDNRTAEATQLVMEISNSGLQLDVETYDALIEASMCSQDFQSAFSLFRDMREARIPDLKGSYLTMMTGLMENHRPELMAAFLDEVVEDPRVEVGTHDWNSIIHAFCKAGRLEDARRTFRRMMFLQFEPNDQTYLSMINGYVLAEKYFLVLMLWNEVKRKLSVDGQKGIKFDHNLVDAFLYAMVKGGFFDAAMQVVEKAKEMKIFVDKWRYKQAFMETHKKLKVARLRKRNFRKMEALIAFKNWAGLNA
uniref:Pentatricopeptide repeat-containing protein At1g69290 family n=1 Tax=Cajanus cajan TaxID=3821 RepID=A0A151TF89_CAJCA|nr:Pentatricopeptide repeat-containing protein At1g69290 family [Cajanus cajan]